MKTRSIFRAYTAPVAAALLLLAGLYWATFHGDERRRYVLFHSLAEGFSIVVACCIFVIALNARRFLSNHYLLVIGIAYAFVAAIEGVHALAFRGLQVFNGYEPVNLAGELWLCARGMEAASLLIAPVFIRHKANLGVLLGIYAAITGAALWLVFWGPFPDCFHPGTGLTTFKICAEYAICATLLGAIALLWANREHFDRQVFALLTASMLVAVATEVFFTRYTTAYGPANFFGHYLQIISFYLVYKAIIETGFARPYSLLLTDLKRSEESLRESEQRYRSLVELSPETIAVHDGQEYVYINAAGAALFGAGSAQEIVGRRVLDLVHPSDRPKISERIANLMATGCPAVARQTRMLRLDGRVVDVEASATLITFRGDAAVQLLLRDISQRKREERAQRFLADAGTILAGSLDYQTTLCNVARLAVASFADCCGVDILGEDGLPHRVAAATAQSEREPLVKLLQEQYSPHLRPTDRVVKRVIEGGESILLSKVEDANLKAASWDEQHLSILHQLAPTSAMLVPLTARGRRTGMLIFLLCDPSRHYDDQDLKAAQELARRAALGIDNARLHAEARHANAAKDQFLAVLSHELRTPLTPVLLATGSLERDPALPEELRDELTMIRRNVELEARLIDDLLDITRISHGKLELHARPTDLHAKLDSAMRICEPDIQAKGVCLTAHLDAPLACVSGDPQRLHQVFWNLIKNAVKFTPAGGRIEISTSNPNADGIRIDVIDTGIGIERQLLPKLFDAFEQGGRDITRQFGGLGLGLAICRALVQMHGGSISASSDGPGTGAKFTIDLPLVAAELAKPQRDLSGASGARPESLPLRILLVEDHGSTANILAKLLRGLRHDVQTAGDIASAKQLASQHGFDIVVSDLGLPDGSGLELMQYLKEQYGLRGVALSGYGMEEDIQRSVAAGFSAHVTKPADFDLLKEAIDRVAGKGQARTPGM